MKNLKNLLLQSWSRETSFSPELWSEDNPALGQCAVTALLVQEKFGGKIMRCLIVDSTDSHYFNIVGTGETIDLTKSQFRNSEAFINEKEVSREKILSHLNTVRRYKILRNKILLL